MIFHQILGIVIFETYFDLIKILLSDLVENYIVRFVFKDCVIVLDFCFQKMMDMMIIT